ncbi:hypothetical protein OS493_001693 [Desmophyllum pertusum]|uniref:FAM91 C-terminal domain-containing protein n=1 Tax=Desmophyllum pertusum TaxID=174260 RepID=A0A9X0CUR8_9CNID|nr:hypothetical protein OS493_001693 [Desmophyllum pertusum]
MAAATIPRRQIFVRPRSEVITVLGWRQVSNDIAEQWRSETCLDGKFFENEERQLKTGYVCGSYEFTREELDESGSEMATEEETDIPDANPDLQRSVLTINLKPASVQVKPRLVKAQSMASLPRKAEVNIAGHSQSKDRERSGLNRRKSSLDVSLAKLRHEMVDTVAEGEAQRYFDHAITLRDTILFLRYNRNLGVEPDQVPAKGLDLLRCESLNSLDSAACGRVLQKNYSLLVSMAPLSNEIRPVTSCCPPHFGPAVPEVNSVWFKLFIYDQVKSGPPSLLLVKGTRLRWLPKIFEDYERLMITTWGHDPGIVPVSNVLLALTTHCLTLQYWYRLMEFTQRVM